MQIQLAFPLSTITSLSAQCDNLRWTSTKLSKTVSNSRWGIFNACTEVKNVSSSAHAKFQFHSTHHRLTKLFGLKLNKYAWSAKRPWAARDANSVNTSNLKLLVSWWGRSRVQAGGDPSLERGGLAQWRPQQRQRPHRHDSHLAALLAEPFCLISSQKSRLVGESKTPRGKDQRALCKSCFYARNKRRSAQRFSQNAVTRCRAQWVCICYATVHLGSWIMGEMNLLLKMLFCNPLFRPRVADFSVSFITNSGSLRAQACAWFYSSMSFVLPFFCVRFLLQRKNEWSWQPWEIRCLDNSKSALWLSWEQRQNFVGN